MATMDTGRAHAWEGESVEDWRSRWGVPVLEVHDCIDSTNDRARDLAVDGAAQGTVVIAAEQRAGRGRRGRSWTAAPGSSLLLSMVLRPAALGAESVLSLRLGMAAARAVESVVPLAPARAIGLKWPNDLVLDGRKLGGILCEGALEGGRPVYLIAGIGLNLSQRDDDWPPEIRHTATSLATSAGRAPSAPALAGRLVAEWLAAVGRDASALTPAEITDYQRRDVLRGHAVTVDGAPAGVAEGVAPNGALLLRHEAVIRPVIAGTVRVCQESDDDPEGATP